MLPAPAVPFSYDDYPPDTAFEFREAASRIRGEVWIHASSITKVGRDLIAVKAKLAHGASRVALA